jgi:hypothetical protein
MKEGKGKEGMDCWKKKKTNCLANLCKKAAHIAFYFSCIEPTPLHILTTILFFPA